MEIYEITANFFIWSLSFMFTAIGSVVVFIVSDVALEREERLSESQRRIAIAFAIILIILIT